MPADVIERVITSQEAQDVGLKRRKYQLDAVRQIVRAVARKRSIELRLPTGTGKTLIADLAALKWRETRPRAATMIVAPRRTLASQHNRMAAWLQSALPALLVTDESAGNAARLIARAEQAALIIGLPGLLTRCIETLALPASVIKRLAFVVIDEFDEFLNQEYDTRGIAVRFDRDFERLRQVLPRSIPVLLMSGTPPGAAAGDEAARLADFVNRAYRPLAVDIPKRAYSAFLPTARVRLRLVDDASVCLFDEAIGTDLMFALNELGAALKAHVDESWLFPRLPGLLAKPPSIRVIRLTNGRTVAANKDALNACSALQAAINRSVFLQEDMLGGYAAQVEKFLFQRWDAVEPVLLERPRFIVRPPTNEYQPALQGKYEAVVRIAQSRPGERGVVFVRYVQLAETLATAVRSHRIRVETLHGEMTHLAQSAAQERFAQDGGLLVLTRDTGKRGLDLPQAHYAIFYSPKGSEVSSWQELSRIRSNMTTTKDSFFLTYRGTREQERLMNLVNLMRESGRAYEITSP
jgi:DEAD/DEAH box helicase/Helicase conserved C-terminal domain